MKNNKLEVSDIPQEMMQQIRNQFDTDPTITEMRNKQQLLMREGNFMLALKIGKAIEALFSKVVNEYINEANDEAENIDLKTVNMPQKDKMDVYTLVITLFMACDIIESAIMDFNSIIQRTDKTLVLEQFDDLKDLSKKAKEKLLYLSKNSKFMKDLTWGYRCDDMYAMMQNKARSIIRKSSSKDWGKNEERLNEKK